MSPPKRTSKHTPPHIIAEKLPPNVWYDKSGAGKWMQKYKNAATGKWQSKRLCSGSATLAQIWQAHESQHQTHATTFNTLSTEFQTTLTWRKLAPATQRDYLNCHNSISARATSTGTLGQIALEHWTIGLVRKYRDKRAEESESRANKELSYLKRLFAWAYEYEKIKLNPADGVKKLSIKPRRHYAADHDYHFMLRIARDSGYWYAAPCFEIAYLCRMRLSEVLDLTDANELPGGLLIKRRKNSKDNITAWNERLRTAWHEAKAKRDLILATRKQPTPINPAQRHVFISERTGDRITPASFENAMQRIRKSALEQAQKSGIEFTPFTFHDLKRKGISDTEGDRMKASGHRSASMMSVYDVALDTVKPAGKS